MNSSHNSGAPAQDVQTRILSSLDDLPPESLAMVERFVHSLREQALRDDLRAGASGSQEPPPYTSPTVALPASSLDDWLDLIPEGYEGDALTDTEALCDEV